MVILNQVRKGLYRIATNVDTVVAGVAVPRGASVNQVSGHIDIMTSARIAINDRVNYGLRAFLIPVPDFDTSVTYDVLWDRLVPKDDAATATVDADEAAADTASMDILGEPDLETIMGLHGAKLSKIYKRLVEWSYASKPMHAHLDTTHFYLPGERHKININRKIVAREPSILMFGITNGITTNTAVTLPSTPTITEWARMMTLDHTLQEMMLNFIGAVESGAETPYEEAQALVVKLMEPTTIEQASVAGFYLATTLEANVSLNFKVQYPMKRLNRELTSRP